MAKYSKDLCAWVSDRDRKRVRDRKIYQDLIKKRDIHVQQKIKEIRKNFSQAVTSGRSNEGGKVMLEFYDDLEKLEGGSPATESCGVSSKNVN